jgi:hypothetical protein
MISALFNFSNGFAYRRNIQDLLAVNSASDGGFEKLYLAARSY